MMYNLQKRVDLPQKENRIILKNGYVYYYTDMHWDAEKKKTVDNRKPVGKVCPDDNLKMFPNENWKELMGEETPERTAKHMNVGSYICLYKSAGKIGCLKALQESFPNLWDKIFALCVYVIDAKSSAAQLFPYWGFHNYCGRSKPFSDSTISEVFRVISEDDWAVDNFMQYFGRNYPEAIPEAKETAVALDSTNRNTTCKNNKYAQHGKQKVKKSGIPQVNTAIIVDELTGIPIYYENFFGSVLDKTETPVTIEKVKELGFQKLFIAMDSGYASAECMTSFDDGYEFSVMTPESYQVVKYMIRTYAKQIIHNEKYYIRDEKVYGICEKGVNAFSGKYNAYLFYDSKRGQQEIDSIHEKASAILNTVWKRKRFSESLQKKYAPFITITKTEYNPKTKRNFDAEINSDAVQKEIDNAGLFVVVSNSDSTPGRIIKITRMRDKNEKGFERIKTLFDMMASDTHSTATYEGKMFIGFVSLIICEAYRWYIRDILKTESSATAETTLSELRNYQMMKKNDGTYMPVYALSRKQKELFSCFGLDQQSLREFINELPH